MTIEYELNTTKAVQAAAMFLRLHGKPMSPSQLMGLLFIAELKALQTLESPIIGGPYYLIDDDLP